MELCRRKKRDLGGILRYVWAQKWEGGDLLLPSLPPWKVAGGRAPPPHLVPPLFLRLCLHCITHTQLGQSIPSWQQHLCIVSPVNPLTPHALHYLFLVPWNKLVHNRYCLAGLKFRFEQPLTMGFAVRVRSAGQKYGPRCHQRDRADVTEFVTLVRLSSLGQHVGVLALAGYKRGKSALTANPIIGTWNALTG